MKDLLEAIRYAQVVTTALPEADPAAEAAVAAALAARPQGMKRILKRKGAP